MSVSLWSQARDFARRQAQFYAGGLRRTPPLSTLAKICRWRDQFELLTDDELRAVNPASRMEAFGKAAVACQRQLGLRPHDVQILGALSMAEGKIAEMQTGEGKTLAAVMAVYELCLNSRTTERRSGVRLSGEEAAAPCALSRGGDAVHVLTANDYLAQRDAEWMGPVYRFLDLSVGFVTQSMTPAQRRRAYDCRVTYTTPNEVGFDFLRDQMALCEEDLVLPEFSTVLVDEADSILIDEARIPLVIAGGHVEAEHLARKMAEIAAHMVPGRDFRIDEYQRNARLTDHGIARVEREAGIDNLYAEENVDALAAIEAAIHAGALLHRDVDYLVRNGAIELVDEFKGRVAENRRWPAGLQTALEAKERLPLRIQGRILGTITLQNLIRLYPKRCGMTGTAATESHEFREFYNLDVVPIPTHKPVIREDHEDFVFPHPRAKERSVVQAIVEAHTTGRPVLVGTASVKESERLSALAAAAGIPHRVLNARQDAEEARIVAQAGQRGAVTISTNMAGRGTDIVLGEGVAALGGLHVIGTNRHESRRIDHQLRGRAGRQGDPGSSQFYVSLEDDLMVRYDVDKWSRDAKGVEMVQRAVESQNFQIRQMLWKYDGLLESHRQVIHTRRRELLREHATPQLLLALDELWAEHLACVTELREGIHWRSWGGREPFYEFVHDAEEMFQALMERLERLSSGEEPLPDHERGATWTYLVTDQPFGLLGERQLTAARRWLREKLRQ
jgi:preprotein translocase subunit SecA